MNAASRPLVSIPAPAPTPAVRELRRLSLVAPPRYEQGVLALTYPSDVTAVSHPSHRAIATVGIPDPSGWSRRLLQAMVEVVSLERPISQLARWTSAEVYARVDSLQREESARRARTERPARETVASVHVCQVAPDVAEVAARVSGGPRSRALAARLDFRRGRWTCTALSIG